MLEQVRELVRTAREGFITLDETQKAVHRAYVVDVLEQYHGNQQKAARDMGIHRNTISRMVGELEIDVHQIRRSSKKQPAGVGAPAVKVVRHA